MITPFKLKHKEDILFYSPSKIIIYLNNRITYFDESKPPYILKIAKELKYHYCLLNRTIINLEELGLIRREKIGRRSYVYLNRKGRDIGIRLSKIREILNETKNIKV